MGWSVGRVITQSTFHVDVESDVSDVRLTFQRQPSGAFLNVTVEVGGDIVPHRTSVGVMVGNGAGQWSTAQQSLGVVLEPMIAGLVAARAYLLEAQEPPCPR